MIARVWDEDDRYERAFVQVKELMKRAWTLAMPDWKQPFYLATDASGVAIGAVLYQVIDGQPRPLAFGSRKLLPSQREKWSVTQKEAYAVLVFTGEFRHYLVGRRFVLQTDHQALVSMFRNATASPVILRWALRIASLDCDLLYIEGDNNIVADALSRMYEEAPEKPRFLRAWAATPSKRVVYLARGDTPVGVPPEAAVVAVRVNTLELRAGFESQIDELVRTSPDLVAAQRRDLLFEVETYKN